MSRAFTKEDTGTGVEQLPDLPVSPHPNHVTPQGLAALQQRLRDARAEHAALQHRKEEIDAMQRLAIVERDMRYYEQRVGSAIAVDPATQPQDTVAFGATVEVIDEEGQPHTYRIVGEDEADPARGLITAHSPLAKALIGARIGDTAQWRKPSGVIELEITAIRTV